MNEPGAWYPSLEAANDRIMELEQLVRHLRSRELPVPNNEIAEVFHRLNIGAPLSEGLLDDAFTTILTNPQVRAREFQLGAMLSGLMVRGPKPGEVAALIRAALRVDGVTRIKPALPGGERLICVAGSGKKGQKTFNISTPSCLVACAAGAYIAKPCSSATSSITGSRDFLQLLGARILDTEAMIDVMLATGFGAFSIESMVPKFDAVYGGRVYCITPLSYALPALVNPVVCDSVYYGLAHPNLALSLEVFRDFGFRNAMVVTSSDDDILFIDELSPLKHNYYGLGRDHVVGKVIRVFTETLTSEGPAAPHELHQGGSVEDNLRLAVQVLRGQRSGAPRAVIALNAGALLMLAGKVPALLDGYKLAVETITRGHGLEKLVQFIEATGGHRGTVEAILRDER